jgi:hypothetical protein
MMLHFPRAPEEPLEFASRSERACGMMLERYVPNFELVTGQTFQVSIGYNKTCDFLVAGVFVEYHPMVLKHDFDDRQAYRRFWQGLKHVRGSARDVIIKAVTDELAEKYYRRRQFLCRLSAGKDSELIVARNPGEFYDLVIKRFGDNFPRRDVWLKEFKALKE